MNLLKHDQGYINVTLHYIVSAWFLLMSSRKETDKNGKVRDVTFLSLVEISGKFRTNQSEKSDISYFAVFICFLVPLDINRK